MIPTPEELEKPEHALLLAGVRLALGLGLPHLPKPTPQLTPCLDLWWEDGGSQVHFVPTHTLAPLTHPGCLRVIP